MLLWPQPIYILLLSSWTVQNCVLSAVQLKSTFLFLYLNNSATQYNIRTLRPLPAPFFLLLSSGFFLNCEMGFGALCCLRLEPVGWIRRSQLSLSSEMSSGRFHCHGSYQHPAKIHLLSDMIMLGGGGGLSTFLSDHPSLLRAPILSFPISCQQSNFWDVTT